MSVVAGLGVHLDRRRCARPPGQREVRRVVDGGGVRGSAPSPSGRSCAVPGRERRAPGSSSPCRARPSRVNAPSANSRSSSADLELVGRDRARLVDHLLASRCRCADAADGQRPRAVGVHARAGEIAVSPCSTSTSSTSTPSSSATICDHVVSCPWPCGEVPGDDLHLAGAAGTRTVGARPSRRRRSGARRGCSTGARPHIST